MTTPIDIEAAEKLEPTLSAAQRIAEIHPPVGVMVLTDAAGQQRAVGCWVADRCPEWVAAIDRIIMAELASEIADARAEALKGTLSELRTLRADNARLGEAVRVLGEECYRHRADRNENRVPGMSIEMMAVNANRTAAIAALSQPTARAAIGGESHTIPPSRS